MTQTKVSPKVPTDAAIAAATAIANRALNVIRPASPGTFLISGGTVAFQGTRSFAVSPATYVINNTQYNSPQTTVTLGAGDATNPRFDAIVVDTTGTVSVVAGTASATAPLPDVDQLLYLVITYIQVDAAASAVNVAVTDIYRENVEWTSSVSGGAISAASTSGPRTGTKCIDATAAAANDYVRLTSGAPVSLSGQKQLVLYVLPKAAFPNAKSISITFYLSGVKVGQSVALQNGSFGFNHSSAVYQQIVLPIGLFNVPSTSQVDRVEAKVLGGGGSIGFKIDDWYLEGNSAAVPQPAITALQQQVENLRIRNITFTFDGGGFAIVAGQMGDQPVDFSGKILGWTLLGDQSGSIVIDVWRDTYTNYPPTVADTITASAKPTITTAVKAQSSSLVGWNTSFNAGDTFRAKVDSATTLTRAVLTLKVQAA